MNIFKLSGLAGLSLVALSTFNACTDYTPFNEADIFHHEYSKNFFAKYGNFPADMNWDLSDQPRTSATDPSVFELGWNGGAKTRAANNVTVNIPTGDDKWYNVPSSTLTWMKQHLVEGDNNTTLGSPFSLIYENSTNPEANKFALIPIYKGSACLKWELRLTDGTNDVLLWDPWAGREINDEYMSDLQFTNSRTGNYENMPLRGNMGNPAESYGNGVRSRPIIVSNISGEFSLYLKLYHCLPADFILEIFEKNNNLGKTNYSGPDGYYAWDYGWSRGYGSEGECQYSTAGMMLALNCDISDLGLDTPAFKQLVGISEGLTIDKVMILGCEDCKTNESDWDINDIVFLMVGLTELPQKREVIKSKRYLIEDLGTTVDFDFNDVVVDVTETAVHGAGETYGVDDIYTQEAVIRHLCGTVPFTVSFNNGGNTSYSTASFGEIQGIVQNINEEYKPDGNYVKIQYSQKPKGLTGIITEKPFWISSDNNIRINVEDNRSDGTQGNIKTASFERPGSSKAPYIIAVPTTVMWTSENEDFPIDKVTEYNTPVSNSGE